MTWAFLYVYSLFAFSILWSVCSLFFSFLIDRNWLYILGLYISYQLYVQLFSASLWFIVHSSWGVKVHLDVVFSFATCLYVLSIFLILWLQEESYLSCQLFFKEPWRNLRKTQPEVNEGVKIVWMFSAQHKEGFELKPLRVEEDPPRGSGSPSLYHSSRR